MSHPSEESGLELRETSAKGCGVYALRDFAAGERLLAESPLVECLVQDARGTVQPAAAHSAALCAGHVFSVQVAAAPLAAIGGEPNGPSLVLPVAHGSQLSPSQT